MSICSASARIFEHLISTQGISADLIKIGGIFDWPRPKRVKALRGFLGLTRYHRRFVKNYRVIAKPLTNLVRKDSFLWSELAETAFSDLKQALMTIPVHALPDFLQSYFVETDACHSGVGAVLLQSKQPLGFLSKALPPSNWDCLPMKRSSGQLYLPQTSGDITCMGITTSLRLTTRASNSFWSSIWQLFYNKNGSLDCLGMIIQFYTKRESIIWLQTISLELSRISLYVTQSLPYSPRG